MTTAPPIRLEDHVTAVPRELRHDASAEDVERDSLAETPPPSGASPGEMSTDDYAEQWMAQHPGRKTIIFKTRGMSKPQGMTWLERAVSRRAPPPTPQPPPPLQKLDFYYRVAECKRRSRIELKKTWEPFRWLALKPAVFCRPLNTQPWDDSVWSVRVDVKLLRFLKWRLLPLYDNFMETRLRLAIPRMPARLQVRYRRETGTWHRYKSRREVRYSLDVADQLRFKVFAGDVEAPSVELRHRQVINMTSAVTLALQYRFGGEREKAVRFTGQLKRRF